MPTLTAAAKANILAFQKQLDDLKAWRTCSEKAKEAIDKLKEIINKLESDPKKIAEIIEIFGPDSFGLLLTDKEYIALFKTLLDFSEKNPPNKLFEGASVKVAFAAIQTQWDNAINNLKMTAALFDFINHSEEFAQTLKPETTDAKRAQPYLEKLNNTFKDTDIALGKLMSANNDKASDQERLFSDVMETYQKDCKTFMSDPSIGEKSIWQRVNDLPYYFIRGISPEMLIKNIDEPDWDTHYMFVTGCRQGVLKQRLSTEMMINDLAKKLGKPARANFFFRYLHDKTQAESKQSDTFKAMVNDHLNALKKHIDNDLKPGLFGGEKHNSRKVNILKALQKDLERCFRKGEEDNIGNKVTAAFKAILRATLWHSRILAESTTSGKKLSSGKTGKFLKHYYDIFFKLYFQTNEFNSGFFPMFCRSHEININEQLTTNTQSLSLPAIKARNAEEQPELAKFNACYKMLCKDEVQAAAAATPMPTPGK